MTEYIEREYAADAVMDVYYNTPSINLSYEKFEAAILKIPASDVAPVRHGKWTSIGYDCGENEYQCSECRRTEWRESADDMKFCMFCGARMDGGAD